MIEKHAYLILAHSSKSLLIELIRALDDERNDIYVHIDKKANFDLSDIRINYSQLYVLSKRYDARWGDYSLVEVELELMSEASSRCSYLYYHILSGVDFPLASQDKIHSFFKFHFGKEFIGFANHASPQEIHWRAQHYFIFSSNFKTKNFLIRLMRRMIADLQTVLRYKRYPGVVKKGCQWCSITNDFVKYILSNKTLIKKWFDHTYCPDEMFIQTLCWNSSFRDNVFDMQYEFKGCLRYINWDNGNIHIMDEEDPQKMVLSGAFFARKFSEEGLDNMMRIKELYSLH